MAEIHVTENGISLDTKPKTIRRFHFFHRWTKWEIVRNGDVTRHSDSAVVGKFKDLERRCTVCGKLEAYEVRT